MIRGISTGRHLSIAGGKTRKSVAMANDICKIIPYCEENPVYLTCAIAILRHLGSWKKLFANN
jgi:hypothetical protein